MAAVAPVAPHGPDPPPGHPAAAPDPPGRPAAAPPHPRGPPPAAAPDPRDCHPPAAPGDSTALADRLRSDRRAAAGEACRRASADPQGPRRRDTDRPEVLGEVAILEADRDEVLPATRRVETGH